MVDYTRGTGNGGVMLIRDTGSAVEFHIRSGLSATWVGSPGFGWSGNVNGQGVGGQVANIQGTTWRHLGTWGVGTSQVVNFSIANSGTQGFGGPTSFDQQIDRAPTPPPVTPPGAPGALSLTYRGHTRLGVSYSRGAENGGAILQDRADWIEINGSSNPMIWQDNNCAGYTDPNDGVAGPVLKQYTEYHIYIYSRNSAGWGPGTMISARTYASGYIKFNDAYRPYVRYVKYNGVYREAIPYQKVDSTYRASRN
jgi:hypothetical protein